MRKAIVARNVTKTFGEGAAAVRALDGVSLDVHRGEVVLLMGPSGSGKTTLLSVLGCILRPTGGQVWINGREVTGYGEAELPGLRLENIGFVFQGFNLFPTLTAGENIELGLDLKGIRGAAARRHAAELLAQVDMADKYSSYPADLSGGQKQRVAIARALAGNPPIILADEPTAALDSHSGRGVIEILRGLAHERECAVVIVTHDPRVLEFGDRLLYLQDGKIAQDALPLAPSVALPALAATSGALGIPQRVVA